MERPDVWAPGCCRVGCGPEFLFLEAPFRGERWETQRHLASPWLGLQSGHGWS